MTREVCGRRAGTCYVSRNPWSIVRTFFALLLLLPTLAFAAPGEPTARERKAAEYASQAHDALQEGRIEEAYKLADKALKKDGANVRAHFVRGMILLVLAGETQEEDKQKMFIAYSRSDLEFVSKNDPEGTLGGIARGFLSGGGQGRPSLDVPAVTCPDASVSAFNAAEQAFSHQDFPTARVAYLLALEGCPQNPTWHVFLGDVYFAEGDRAEALRRYDRALALDACNWQAHRFIADHAVTSGQLDVAYDHLVDAVSCNPNYAEGRGSMGDLLRSSGGKYRWPDAPSQGVEAQSGEPWATLAAERAKAVEAGASRMDGERVGVKAALAAWRAAPTENEVFRLLDEAEAAGKLDHAIYALLLDKALFESFLAWRVDHRAELADYIRTTLAKR